MTADEIVRVETLAEEIREVRAEMREFRREVRELAVALERIRGLVGERTPARRGTT